MTFINKKNKLTYKLLPRQHQRVRKRKYTSKNIHRKLRNNNNIYKKHISIKARGRFDEVSCLIHGTAFPKFIQILTAGHITASPGDPPQNIKGHIETLNKGAFFQLVLNCDEGVPLDLLCIHDVILVFSKDILEYPYHISNNWAGGMIFQPLIPGKISTLVKSYDDVNDYIADNADKLCHGSHSRNEVVFNNNISIDYLIEVWICNIPHMRQIINTKNPDGTYTRKPMDVDFNPLRIKTMVERALTLYNKPIPVKILNNISEIS